MNIVKKRQKTKEKNTIQVKKTIIKTLKIIGSFLFVFFVINGNAFIIQSATYNANDISKEVYAQLEKDGFITVALRGIGKLIASILSVLLDLLEVSFTTLAKYDFLSLQPIANVEVNLEKIILVLLFLGFVFIVFVRMFSNGNPLQPLVNAVIMLMCMSIFTYTMGALFQVRTALIDETSGIMGARQNEMISDALFRSNTYDLIASLEENRLVRLNEVLTLDLDYLDTEMRIKRATFNDVIVGVNWDGTFQTESLHDGMFGHGDVRYFAYRTDFLALNVSLVLTVVVFLIGLFKLGFLCGQFFQLFLWGRLAMGSMLSNIKGVFDVLMEGVGNTLSIWILFFMISVYGLLASAILQNDVLGNWLGNAILIFAIGMLVLIGDEKILEKLNINTGGMILMKSLFAGGKFMRIGKKIGGKTVDGVSAGVNAGKKGVDAYKDFRTQSQEAQNAYEDMSNERNMKFANSSSFQNGSTKNDFNDSNSPKPSNKENETNDNDDTNYGTSGVVLTKDGLDYKNAYKNDVWKEQAQQQREQEQAEKQSKADEKYRADYERKAIMRDEINRDVWARGKEAQENNFKSINDYEAYKQEKENHKKLHQSEENMSDEEYNEMLKDLQRMQDELKLERKGK